MGRFGCGPSIVFSSFLSKWKLNIPIAVEYRNFRTWVPWGQAISNPRLRYRPGSGVLKKRTAMNCMDRNTSKCIRVELWKLVKGSCGLQSPEINASCVPKSLSWLLNPLNLYMHTGMCLIPNEQNDSQYRQPEPDLCELAGTVFFLWAKTCSFPSRGWFFSVCLFVFYKGLTSHFSFLPLSWDKKNNPVKEQFLLPFCWWLQGIISLLQSESCEWCCLVCSVKFLPPPFVCSHRCWDLVCSNNFLLWMHSPSVLYYSDHLKECWSYFTSFPPPPPKHWCTHACKHVCKLSFSLHPLHLPLPL